MARDKSVYTTTMAVSPEMKEKVQEFKVKNGYQSDAGALAALVEEGFKTLHREV